MEDKENTINVDKKEMWEQIKQNSETEPYSVRFEAIDIDNKEGKMACFVDVHQPFITSNLQHAALLSGILDWIDQYVGNIKSPKDVRDKSVEIEEIMNGMLKIQKTLRGKIMESALNELKDLKKQIDGEGENE